MNLRRATTVFSILMLAYAASCIDPVDIVQDTERGQLVVDGAITNAPGPYTITLTKSRSIKTEIDVPVPITKALILMEDDIGHLDTLSEVEPGKYETTPGIIQGEVGRKYRVQIKTNEGHVYKTEFQEMLPVGQIDTTYYKLVKKYFQNELGNEEFKYEFDLYADGSMPSTPGSFAQWKWSATYEIQTYPKYRTRISKNDPDFDNLTVVLPDPPRCSGYIFIKELYLSSGLAYYSLGEECVCCQCWVTEFSSKPALTSNRFNQNNFYDVALGSISAQDVEPFRYRFKVTVEMLSLNEDLFKYLETVNTQGSNDLFVPPIGRLKSNITPVDGAPEAFGLFRVSATSKRTFEIPSIELPFGLNKPADSLRTDCRIFKNSTNQRPADWN